MVSEVKWRNIPGYEGWYQASNVGSIRSIDRKIEYNDIGFCGKNRIAKFNGRILSQRMDNKAKYYRVRIRKLDGKAGGEMQLVHRLIALAFCEKREGCDYVNHLDGNKLNNEASNLEWTTSSGNQLHALATGLKRRNAKGILTEKNVMEIRIAKKYYGFISDLSRKYGVAKVTISAIRNRKNWKHV